MKAKKQKSEETRTAPLLLNVSGSDIESSRPLGLEKKPVKKGRSLSPQPQSSLDELRESATSQNSASLKSISSILKPRGGTSPAKNKLSPSSRKDNFGVPIGGGSGHRIVFAKKLTNVHLVENWGKYNSEEPQRVSCCEIF